MDEYEGILRVVSQPGVWSSAEPPRIETFTVASASEITPLGSLVMTLPRPEALQSVRFDGPRAYAITFEQTDPLFTLDLTDPANPRQVGELEIPGWIYHMEPRGDRVLALGYDQSNATGSINVSLFDVADFAAPQLVSRVNFGGDWASFGEDQNRIHKAFEILDELDLLLVPFSGWQYADENDWCGTWQSGIQLVDWLDDDLTARGLAQSRGRARRALLHRARVLGISDESVESFDITNRDMPVRTADVALASHVNALGLGSSIVARLSTDWWTTDVALEIVDAADPEAAEPLGRLSLASLAQPNPECYDPGFYDAELFVNGGWVYLLHDVDDGAGRSSALEVFDARDPTAPTHASTLALPFARGWDYGYGYDVGAQDRRSLLVGDALVITRSDRIYDVDTYVGTEGAFEIVDVSDPAAPVLAATVERPDALAHGGLQLHGDTLISWHMQAAAPDGAKVRFYLDRLDVADPAAPSVRTPVNVPGQGVAYDPGEGRAITAEVELQALAISQEDCWSHAKVHHWDEAIGQCWIANRRLHLVDIDGDVARMIDSVDPEGEDGRLVAVAASQDRVFAHVRRGTYGWYGGEVDGTGGNESIEPPTDEIAVLSPAASDELAITSTLGITRSAALWLGAMRAAGTHLVVSTDSGLAIVDAGDPTQPTVAITPLYGYGCWDLAVDDARAYCAMGEYGLQAVPLQ